MDRRTFLKGSLPLGMAMLGAGTWAGRAHAGKRPGPNDRVNVAGIGLGDMGRKDLGGFLMHPAVEVVALCDVDGMRRERGLATVQAYHGRDGGGTGAAGCTAYNDFREVLAREDVDAVFIATPDHWHALIALAAMRAGKDVYCEKPLTLTLAEGRALADAAARYGRVFQTGTQLRSHKAVHHTVELLRNGVIGRIEKVEVGLPLGASIPLQPPMPVPEHFDYDLWLGPAPWAPYTEKRCHFFFRGILDYSGGGVTDLGTHYFDVAQWACGKEFTGPVHVEGQGHFYKNMLSNVAASCDFRCTYEDGLILHASTDFGQGCTFHGDEGWVRLPLGYPGPETAVPDKTIAASAPHLLHMPLGADSVRLRGGGQQPGQDYSFAHHFDFIDGIRTRRPVAAPAETGHRSTSIAHLGNIAMRLGQPLDWDPKAEGFINNDDANAMIARPMRGPWRLG